MLLDVLQLPPWHDPLWTLPVFIVGCCLGSFFNVCIYRIPLGISVVTPRSRCSTCGVALKAYQNLPLLGYWLKGGWCACGLTRIDRRYFFVELATALLFTALWHISSPVAFFVYGLFLSGLLISSLIDLDYYIIPDRFSLGGIICGVTLSFLYPALQHSDSRWIGLSSAALGVLVGGGILWAISRLGRWVFKKEAMGMGDIKLLAAMGAFLGWHSILYILGVGSLLGSILGLLLLRTRPTVMGNRLPFGPFLSLAAASWIFGGEHLAAWYLQSVLPSSP